MLSPFPPSSQSLSFPNVSLNAFLIDFPVCFSSETQKIPSKLHASFKTSCSTTENSVLLYRSKMKRQFPAEKTTRNVPTNDFLLCAFIIFIFHVLRAIQGMEIMA
jgi:hypothetical protein